ncbi:MAG: diguanylate cyclase (GGDEF)-like protein/PAS domain S-box-containing protein [Flavobacteriales bacterium]|jgi:diguanylate cyclase (GGDEF)-like protein/PAS domain S-box-containing protein
MSKSLRVLFAEDSEDDVELTVNELIRGGYAPVARRVDTPSGMQSALTDEKWDVVICDYRMPRFTAEQALTCLLESGKDLPFIILSGVVGAVEAVTLLRCGAHDFLNKDDLARLIPAIERELRETVERSERKRAEERVRILSSTVEQSPVSVVITDVHGVITYVNPQFERLSGYITQDAVGKNLDFSLYKKESEALFAEAWSTMNEGESWKGELCSVRSNSQIFWEFVNISPLVDDSGATTHFIVVKEDITVRRSYEAQLLRKAHYDDLTGLANRALMVERLEEGVNLAMLNNGVGAILCIDLDHFKKINDTLGHSVGDELLIQAVSRLACCIRKGDTLARMGGDEFVIILPDIENMRVCEKVAERVVELFSSPFLIRGHSHFVTSSVGIAIFPRDGTSHQELLRNSDLAMYKAKDLGRNQYQCFTEEINRKLKERVILEGRLRDVLKNNELSLHYQPVIDIKSKIPIAYEALLRWRQPDGSYFPPAEFIPIAEDMGLIVDIGKWVIETACEDLARITRSTLLNLRLAINVSPKQLNADDFTRFVDQQIKKHHLKPSQLELEITESVLVEDQMITKQNILALSESGFSLSIDDFGTGYSALSYLHKYPFNTLKIDRSFIHNLLSSDSSARLVETIIKMAHNLGLTVIGEGVEEEEQMAFLKASSCDLVQGYLYGKPKPIEEYFPWAHQELMNEKSAG